MIAQFALRLLLGMSLTWAVLPRREITSGFFRIQLLVALGLSVLAAVTVGDLFAPHSEAKPSVVTGRSADATDVATGRSARPTDIVTGRSARPTEWAAVGVCISLAICAFAGSIAWTLERRAGGTAFLFAILAGTAALLAASAELSLGFGAMRWFRFVSEASSSAILGGCVTAMLLGHWYLTAPTMSIAPLTRANVWFGASAILRAAVSACGLSLVSQGGVETSTHLVWLALRWGAGIVLPLVLAVMVARILKYRNTQSATGVLFAAVILVFLGELAGMLLSREVGIPL